MFGNVLEISNKNPIFNSRGLKGSHFTVNAKDTKEYLVSVNSSVKSWENF